MKKLFIFLLLLALPMVSHAQNGSGPFGDVTTSSTVDDPLTIGGLILTSGGTLQDNVKLNLGTDGDASIYVDGVDLYVSSTNKTVFLQDFFLEGGTNDGFELQISVTDPQQKRTQTFIDYSGTVLMMDGEWNVGEIMLFGDNGTGEPYAVSSGTTDLGGGDVNAPGSSVDNTVARANGTSGKNIQYSSVAIDDSDNITTAGGLTAAFVIITDPGQGVSNEGHRFNEEGGSTGTHDMLMNSPSNSGVGAAFFELDTSAEKLFIRGTTSLDTNTALELGDAGESSIYFDGADLNIYTTPSTSLVLDAGTFVATTGSIEVGSGATGTTQFRGPTTRYITEDGTISQCGPNNSDIWGCIGL